MDKYLGSDDNTEGPEFAEGIQSEDVIGAINEVFQLGSEKKKQLVENLTALGITASTGETWEMLLGKVLDLLPRLLLHYRHLHQIHVPDHYDSLLELLHCHSL